MPTMLTPDVATLDELGRANIKRVLAGRRLWRPRCGEAGAGGVMFLCFQNRARLTKSDRPTAPGPPTPLFPQHRKRDSQIPGVLPWLDTWLL